MRSGYDVLGRKNKITLSLGNYQVNFDRVIQIGRGILLGMMTEKLVENKKNVMHTTKEFFDKLEHPATRRQKT